MANAMRLTFNGAAGTVTGSSYLLNTGVGKVMIDCGMFQGDRELEQRNYLGFGYDPTDVDFLLLTHAHIDHIGLVPRLVKFGFNGDIYCTKATRDLAEIMLLDSAHIQERDAEYSKKRNVERDRVQSHALYTADDVVAAMRRFRTVEYEQAKELTRNISVRYRDAGHILGSASIEITVKTAEGAATLVASGDVGQPNTAILKDPKVFERADYLLLETTYGDRNHEDFGNRKELLKAEIERIDANGSALIIPSFAVGRTQQILYHIAEIKAENPHLRGIPIVVDSPLASKATDIVGAHPECFDPELAKMLGGGRNPFHAEGLTFTESVEDSKALNTMRGPCVIMSASGMCTAGRIRHHLANRLADDTATILFVGHQGTGTLGRIILDGAKSVTLFGERIPVRARIASINGFSAHADQSALLKWLEAMQEKPQTVYLVHGEPKPAETFEGLLKDRGYTTHIAVEDETVFLPLLHSVTAAETRAPLASRVDRAAPARDTAPAITAPVATAPSEAPAHAFTLPSPPHPGDSAKSRVTRYLRWLAKELGDASFVVDEIDAEMDGWLALENLPLSKAQSAATIFDDMLAEIAPLLLKVFAAYEKKLIALEGAGSHDASNVVAIMGEHLKSAIADGRKRILGKLDD